MTHRAEAVKSLKTKQNTMTNGGIDTQPLSPNYPLRFHGTGGKVYLNTSEDTSEYNQDQMEMVLQDDDHSPMGHMNQKNPAITINENNFAHHLNMQ